MDIPDKAPENLSKQPDQGRSPSGKEPPMTMKENVVPQHTRPQGSTVAPSGRDHEYKDISFKSIVRFAVVLVVITVVTHVLLWGVFEILDSRVTYAEEYNPMALPNTLPPAPRLQVDEGEDINEFRMQEDSMMQAYGWLDRNAGVARIPIDRAIEVIATKGLPSTSAAAASAPRNRDTAGSASDSAAQQGGRNFGPTREPNNAREDYAGEGPGEGRRP